MNKFIEITTLEQPLRIAINIQHIDHILDMGNAAKIFTTQKYANGILTKETYKEVIEMLNRCYND